MTAATFALGGDLVVHRTGFGALRLTGEGGWGLPPDVPAARAVLRRAVELGVDLIDTADAYGPGSNEELIASTLHPYAPRLVVATKVGQCRPAPGVWVPLGRPEYLRQQVELSLRRLRVARLDLLQLHRIDPLVPVAEQLGVLAQLRSEGKVRHVGLSEVTVAELRSAREFVPVVSVQNRYNLTDRKHEAVVEYCEREGIGFIPWHPVGKGSLTRGGGAIADVAGELGATASQVALSWLLHRSPAILLIPGTSSVAHLAENQAASRFTLSSDQYRRLDAITPVPQTV
ncbi:aldo/keto reductase [Actinokineospora auranticolor]|uniref:Aryl-alcohol dehydrogenase-like predicted oxidoreductase n=1 Tax=Actinokineospora auranticolor TaxID=155976 RepID=A0A2S6GTI0_9PSEU|nr:aldo/keto reductase [Actinokineospora auranticolor]PPK68493.1 aryl-alcohol dehydrogenase-like predicted oxidoreductase [Actinokineospora auranticolor]